MAALIASGNCSHMRVEPSRSVIRKVTVPVGRSPAIDANPLIAGYKDFSVAADLLGGCELSQSIGGLAAAGRGCGCSNARNSCDRAYGATANGSCTANDRGHR